MSDFDPDEVKQHLDTMMEDISLRAQVDQQQAELDHMRDQGTWWAALAMLAGERGNDVANAVAVQNLKHFLRQHDEDAVLILAAYLLHNTISLVAAHHNDGDVVAAIADIVGPEGLFNFEKFAATSGASCPECGLNDGWVEHNCNDYKADSEPVEG